MEVELHGARIGHAFPTGDVFREAALEVHTDAGARDSLLCPPPSGLGVVQFAKREVGTFYRRRAGASEAWHEEAHHAERGDQLPPCERGDECA